MTSFSNPLQRRSFLKGAAGVGAAAAVASPFGALGARAAGQERPQNSGNGGGQPSGLDYGPLFPVKDQTTGLELLMLPKGFEYISYGWTNEVMSDGTPTPGNHDGMAAFRTDDGVRLVRNHERNLGTPFAPASSTYDPAAGGGTTTLLFDPDAGQWLESYASLSGTIRNCAGGPTPYGTWISCEENLTIPGSGNSATRMHGYNFEVPAHGMASGIPLVAMGRFNHEATATDPATGYVYETEDTGNSVLYRFRPNDPVDLAAGGVLEAMALAGTTDTREWVTGQSDVASWVVVDDPDPQTNDFADSTRAQAAAKGAALITRGEGAWYGNGVIYIVASNGGVLRRGQVFAYNPVTDEFSCVISSTNEDLLAAPDNICVSPRGGIVLCEDGSGLEYMHGLTPDGQIFRFAQNNVTLPAEVMAAKGYNGSGNYTGSEWAGATFEPKNGNWMFANVQSPGITVAITGPWRQGAL
ncbi:MAG TPA: alkaline phosphatase PhoX [Ilumatobacter sp.]|nr:alkaline phosphatase PhoX [Ilumatobacter sp.]